MATNNVVNSSGSGTIVNFDSVIYTTATSTGTSLTPSSTPTTSNTTLLFSLTYAPTSSSNILVFDFNGEWTQDTTNYGVTFFLFAGTTLLCSSAGGIFITGGVSQLGSTGTILYYMTAGTTSSTTYAIYYARTALGTAYVNQNPAGNNYNNTIFSFLTVTELLP